VVARCGLRRASPGTKPRAATQPQPIRFAVAIFQNTWHRFLSLGSLGASLRPTLSPALTCTSSRLSAPPRVFGAEIVTGRSRGNAGLDAFLDRLTGDRGDLHSNPPPAELLRDIHARARNRLQLRVSQSSREGRRMPSCSGDRLQRRRGSARGKRRAIRTLRQRRGRPRHRLR